MAIKFGMGATDTYRSYRINSSREILHCANSIKYYITNVSVVETKKVTVCVDPMSIKRIIDTEDFCIESISGRFNTKANVQWEAKTGASSALPKGSVLNKITSCMSIYAPYSEITVNIRGKGNPESVSPSIIPTVLQFIRYEYANDFIADYIDMGSEADANLSDWERGSKEFYAMTEIVHVSDNYVINHSFNLNVETGLGEARIEKIKYDNTDITDFRNVIQRLKSQ